MAKLKWKLVCVVFKCHFLKHKVSDALQQSLLLALLRPLLATLLTLAESNQAIPSRPSSSLKCFLCVVSAFLGLLGRSQQQGQSN